MGLKIMGMFILIGTEKRYRSSPSKYMRMYSYLEIYVTPVSPIFFTVSIVTFPDACS
jgi:hypothetical protein